MDRESPKVEGTQRILRDNFGGIQLLLWSGLCSSFRLVGVGQPMLLALGLLSGIHSDLVHYLWFLSGHVFGMLAHNHEGRLLLLVLFDGLQYLS